MTTNDLLNNLALAGNDVREWTTRRLREADEELETCEQGMIPWRERQERARADLLRFNALKRMIEAPVAGADEPTKQEPKPKTRRERKPPPLVLPEPPDPDAAQEPPSRKKPDASAFGSGESDAAPQPPTGEADRVALRKANVEALRATVDQLQRPGEPPPAALPTMAGTLFAGLQGEDEYLAPPRPEFLPAPPPPVEVELTVKEIIDSYFTSLFYEEAKGTGKSQKRTTITPTINPVHVPGKGYYAAQETIRESTVPPCTDLWLMRHLTREVDYWECYGADVAGIGIRDQPGVVGNCRDPFVGVRVKVQGHPEMHVIGPLSHVIRAREKAEVKP